MSKINLALAVKGDELYVVGLGGLRFGFIKMTVKRVTPSGMLDLCYQHDAELVSRFSADGRERGNKWRSRYIDIDMTVAERTALLDQMDRQQKAVNALNDLTTKHGCISRYWSTKAMNEVLDGLQAKINAARQLVLEIGVK